VLPQFAADLEWLKSKGIDVERYNLAQQVAAFAANAVVKQALNSKGAKCLPMVLVDGEVKSAGIYPTREQLAEFVSIAYEPGPKIKVRTTELVGIGGVGATK
jgi:hypothetical protein